MTAAPSVAERTRLQQQQLQQQLQAVAAAAAAQKQQQHQVNSIQSQGSSPPEAAAPPPALAQPPKQPQVVIPPSEVEAQNNEVQFAPKWCQLHVYKKSRVTWLEAYRTCRSIEIGRASCRERV